MRSLYVSIFYEKSSLLVSYVKTKQMIPSRYMVQNILFDKVVLRLSIHNPSSTWTWGRSSNLKLECILSGIWKTLEVWLIAENTDELRPEINANKILNC